MPFRRFCSSREPQSEIKSERKDRQILGSLQKTKKAGGHEHDGDTDCNLCTWNGSKRLEEWEIRERIEII